MKEAILNSFNKFLILGQLIPYSSYDSWKLTFFKLHSLLNLGMAGIDYAIALILLNLIYQRQTVPNRSLFLIFSLFAIANGTTHLIEMGWFGHPTSGSMGMVQAITVSIALLMAFKLFGSNPIFSNPTSIETNEHPSVNTRLLQSQIQRLETELSWKETLLLSLSQASPFAIYAVDRDTDTILYFNQQFCKLLGIEHLEKKMPGGDLKTGDINSDLLATLIEIEKHPHPLKTSLPEDRQVLLEDEIDLKDERKIRRFSIPIQDATEQILGHLYLFEDITAYKQIEVALELANVSIERSSLPMAWIDSEARIIRANEATCQTLGYSYEELQALHVWDTMPQFPVETWTHYWQKFKRQENLSLNSKHRRKDGSFISLEVTLNYLEYKGKEYSFACLQDISDRERTEAALRTSEARFQAFMDHSPAAAWITDGNGQIVYLSQSYTRMFQVPNSYAIGKTEMTIYPSDLRREYLKNIRKVVETLQVVEAIEPAPRPDGLMGEFLVYKFPLPSVSGEVLVGGVAIDLTERKRAEAALQQREQEFRALVENAPDIIMRLDREFRYLYINPAVEKQMGFPASIFIGKTLDEFGAPESLTQLWKTTIQNVFETGKEQLIEFESISVKGLAYYASRVVPEFDSQGSVQSVLGITRDISDRKCAEEALRRSESRFKHLTASIPGMVYTLVQDPAGTFKFEYLSPGCEEILEFPPEQILEDANLCFNQFHPEDRHGYQEAVNRNLENLDLFSYEWRTIGPSGKLKWIQARSQPEQCEDGSVVWYGVAQDVSDRKQAEAILQQALAVAEAASIAKSQFLSNMSHELRTPLNAILGFSQVMARSDSLSPEYKEQLQIINRSGEHLLNLINNILSMAKIEAGRIALNENPFDLPQLLLEIDQLLRLKAINKGLSLSIEKSSNLPRFVQADESKLRQVLINLLGNAIKFTQKGSIILRVKLGRNSPFSESNDRQTHSQLTPSTTSLTFEIIDTGPGIASEEMDSLFHPFIQTTTGRQSMQGTGLGLSISQQYVEMMGGTLNVSSQVGQGTCFTFDIQVQEVTSSDRSTPVSTKRVIGLAPDQPTYRILVVEDVEENRLLLLKLLEPLGFHVRQATNGQEALSLWSDWKPHLIWMDMRMPILDGYEATREIKTRERQQRMGDWGLENADDRLKEQRICTQNLTYPSEFLKRDRPHPIPPHLDLAPESPPPLPQNNSLFETVIIALTASAFEEERTLILSAGCDDLICKPFQESVLFDKMAQYLGVRYIYAEEAEPISSESLASKPLTPGDLSVMSSDWIEQLHQAVICANDPILLQLIAQIPDTHANLADTLTDLVHNFRLDILFDLTQMNRNG